MYTGHIVNSFIPCEHACHRCFMWRITQLRVNNCWNWASLFNWNSLFRRR